MKECEYSLRVNFQDIVTTTCQQIENKAPFKMILMYFLFGHIVYFEFKKLLDS